MFNKRIYYISGFDPRGSRFYHRLFREEAKKSCGLSGASIETSKRTLLDGLITQWQVDSVWENQSYKTDYRFMTWDDVIKHYWVSNVWLLVLKALPMYFSHIKSGLFARYKQGGIGPYRFSLYPLLFCVLVALLTVSIACLGHSVLSLVTEQTYLSIALSIGTAFFFMRYAVHLGEKMGVWWVMQSYFLHARWMEKPLPELEKRTQSFAERIIQDQIESPVDEIIVVGHCTGAMLAVAVMSKILSLPHEALKNKLYVMTLGQSIPYLTYATTAQHFREMVQAFANNEHFAWFDMGARIDPLCFQQVNPAEAVGIELKNKDVPYRVKVRPYNMFSARKYNQLKKNRLRMHFQYLMAADIKTDFDYFEIVTGPNAKLQSYRC